jgi:hypothetical protein
VFDTQKGMQVLRDTLSIVNSEYPVGSLEWLRVNRPDVAEQLKGVWKQIGAAIDAEDMTKVKVSAELCLKYHRRAFEIFAGRPPVMEVQGDLLS